MKTIILIISLCCCLWLQAGQVKITGVGAKYGKPRKGRVTIYAVINGKKTRLCKKKKFKDGKTYTFTCDAPDKVDYIALFTDSEDYYDGTWRVKYFIIELPNGDKWQFLDKGKKNHDGTDKGAFGTVIIIPKIFYFTGKYAGELRNAKCHKGKPVMDVLDNSGKDTRPWCKGKKLNAPASETTAKK